MNISLSEIVLVLTIALLVIKPQQLPEVAFSIGRFAKFLRHLVTQMKDQMNGLLDTVEPSTEAKKTFNTVTTTTALPDDSKKGEQCQNP